MAAQTAAIEQFDRIVLEAFTAGIARCENEEAQDLLRDVCSLYALTTIEEMLIAASISTRTGSAVGASTTLERYRFGTVGHVHSTVSARLAPDGELLLKGRPGLRAAWFAVFYLIFMVPLPATLVDALTDAVASGFQSPMSNA